MITPDKHTRAALERLHSFNEYTWRLKISLKPRVCNWSGEKLPMFNRAYKGYRFIYGPDYSAIVVRWISQNAYLIEKLRGSM